MWQQVTIKTVHLLCAAAINAQRVYWAILIEFLFEFFCFVFVFVMLTVHFISGKTDYRFKVRFGRRSKWNDQLTVRLMACAMNRRIHLHEIVAIKMRSHSPLERRWLTDTKLTESIWIGVFFLWFFRFSFLSHPNVIMRRNNKFNCRRWTTRFRATIGFLSPSTVISVNSYTH